MVEAARDVAGGACDAREKDHYQACGDGGLQAQTREAKDEKGNHHYAASCPRETGEHTSPHPQAG